MSGPRRVLIAGMGNVLTRDDGFGVRVAERLQAWWRPVPPGVRIVEVGIGGIHLVQELMDGYDALVVIDAIDRGLEPGSVLLVEPEVRDPSTWADAERDAILAETHYAVPGRALMVARALGVLPARVYIAGCQPGDLELGLEMSEVVSGAVDRCAALVRRVVERLSAGLPPEATGGPAGREWPDDAAPAPPPPS